MSTVIARIDLLPNTAAPLNARRAVTEIMNGWGVTDRRDDILLVVSELVSNAVEHAGGSPSLELELVHSDRWLRIALTDGCAVPPIAKQLDQTSLRGRGIHLMSLLADDWGYERHRDGKQVWLLINFGPS